MLEIHSYGPSDLCDQHHTRRGVCSCRYYSVFFSDLGPLTWFEIDDILSCSLGLSWQYNLVPDVACARCVLTPSSEAGLAPDKDKARAWLDSGDHLQWDHAKDHQALFSHKSYNDLKGNLFLESIAEIDQVRIQIVAQTCVGRHCLGQFFKNLDHFLTNTQIGLLLDEHTAVP